MVSRTHLQTWIGSSYDPTNRAMAFAKAEEWGEKIPVGIYYKEERWTYEGELPMIAGQAFAEQDIENIDIDPILENITKPTFYAYAIKNLSTGQSATCDAGAMLKDVAEQNGLGIPLDVKMESAPIIFIQIKSGAEHLGERTEQRKNSLRCSWSWWWCPSACQMSGQRRHWIRNNKPKDWNGES